MLYTRAEREGDWPLHLEAVKQMMPYFYASGHVNYAWYGLFYLRSMDKLPVEIRGRFMKGEHVISEPWRNYRDNTQQETLNIWAFGLHIRSRIVEDLTHMSDHHSVQAQ